MTGLIFVAPVTVELVFTEHESSSDAESKLIGWVFNVTRRDALYYVTLTVRPETVEALRKPWLESDVQCAARVAEEVGREWLKSRAIYIIRAEHRSTPTRLT